MGTTRIHVCGQVTVAVDGRRVEEALPGNQGRVLLVYLVAHRQRATPRDALRDALWGDRLPGEPEAALSALLSKLRRVLRPARIEGRSRLRLHLPGDAWVDVEAAADALHRAAAAVARGDWAEAWGPARVTQHIAARPFLPGEDAPWIDAIRGRLDTLYLRSLELVATASLAIGAGEVDTAERAARALIAKAPFRESGYRHLMEVMAARGNVAEALQVYETLRVFLRDELGVDPSAETRQLLHQLLGL